MNNTAALRFKRRTQPFRCTSTTRKTALITGREPAAILTHICSLCGNGGDTGNSLESKTFNHSRLFLMEGDITCRHVSRGLTGAEFPREASSVGSRPPKRFSVERLNVQRTSEGDPPSEPLSVVLKAAISLLVGQFVPRRNTNQLVYLIQSILSLLRRL